MTATPVRNDAGIGSMVEVEQVFLCPSDLATPCGGVDFIEVELEPINDDGPRTSLRIAVPQPFGDNELRFGVRNLPPKSKIIVDTGFGPLVFQPDTHDPDIIWIGIYTGPKPDEPTTFSLRLSYPLTAATVENFPALERAA